MKALFASITLALVLGACSSLTGLHTPTLAPPPEFLTEKCQTALSKLPSRDLTQAELEFFLNRDNEIYQDCAGKHAALVDFILERDALLRGERDVWQTIR